MSSIKRAVSPHVPEPAPGTWSNCLVIGNVAYLAGMTARGADLADEYSQAKAIFTKIQHLVEAAGGSMADIVKVTISSLTSASARRYGRPAASSSLAIFQRRPWCKWPRLPIRR